MSAKFALWLKKPLTSEAGSISEGQGLFFKGGNGSTVILIHGLTGSPNEMRFIGWFFNKKGYSVSCPRLANHGKPLHELKKTTWQQCYESVRAEYLRIRAASPHEIIFVAGLSMGALMALLLASEFPEGVAAVSCLSPTFFYDGWNAPRWRHLLPIAYATPLKNFFYFKEDSPYGIKNEIIRERIHKFFKDAKLEDMSSVAQVGYPYFPVTLLWQLQLLVKHLTQRLKGIRTPVQVIQAKEDDMTSTKNADFIYNRISSPLKEIVLLDNSYHIITADQERAKVAEKMDEFFKKVASRLAVRTQL